MIKKKFTHVLITGLLIAFNVPAKNIFHDKIDFNSGWQFVKDIDTTITSGLFAGDNSRYAWQSVTLPHTANIEPLVTRTKVWQGYCFYRKFFTIPKTDKNKHIALHFEAAMQVAEVFLNGKKIFTHLGGYLPFYVNISDRLVYGKENCVLVSVNNLDNPVVPPGKPLKTVDFNYYGGIYRNVSLVKKEKIYISDPVAANRVAGGGIMVTYENVLSDSARINIRVDVQNDKEKDAKLIPQVILKDMSGNEVSNQILSNIKVKSGANAVFQHSIHVNKPNLWSPDQPYLYSLTVKLLDKNGELDEQTIRIGVRTFSFSATEGFILNGKKFRIRGTNRHQEYPYIGNALPDNANYRDAYKIKQAGFNMVRCSHYPQSPAFLNACDELGILVMNSTPGWQFFGNDEFQKNSIQNIRDMVRRDRNHPSIILWEASLNESNMSKNYMASANNAVKEELPATENFTCGWAGDAYDVFIPARQHAKAPDYWKKYNKKRPIFIAEYGDWEYYAQNAGFNQTAYEGLKEEEKNSRQSRGDGQRRMAQQAYNFQESHNDNYQGVAVGDANWLMYDYNRGCDPNIETSGVMDIFRIPKFAYYFYQSQQNPNSTANKELSKPMAYIANFWNDSLFSNVKVYSNCDEIELYLNNQLIGRRTPDRDALISDNLPHPPFSFAINNYKSGELKAVGYIGGKMAVESKQVTAGKPADIKLSVDYSSKPVDPTNDLVLIYARIVDISGNCCVLDNSTVKFSVAGAELIGENPAKVEAGIATILLRITNQHKDQIIISANSETLKATATISVYLK